jgi:hypothetical protein
MTNYRQRYSLYTSYHLPLKTTKFEYSGFEICRRRLSHHIAGLLPLDGMGGAKLGHAKGESQSAGLGPASAISNLIISFSSRRLNIVILSLNGSHLDSRRAQM